VNYGLFFLQPDMCSLEKNLSGTTKLTSKIHHTLSQLLIVLVEANSVGESLLHAKST